MSLRCWYCKWVRAWFRKETRGDDTTVESPRWQAHTPGPWKAIRADPPFSHWAVEATSDGYTATLCSSDGIGLNKSDAHLIAAAPELLEALKACAEQLDGALGASSRPGSDSYDTWKAAIDAITKAEGR